MERLTAKYHGHVSDLNGFTPPSALSAALDEFATPAPQHCPVCYNHRPRDSIIDSHGDFQTVEYHEFTGGLALLVSCFHCHHTIVLSELDRVSSNITE